MLTPNSIGSVTLNPLSEVCVSFAFTAAKRTLLSGFSQALVIHSSMFELNPRYNKRPNGGVRENARSQLS